MRTPSLIIVVFSLCFLSACSETEITEPAITETSGGPGDWPANAQTDQGNFNVTVSPEGGEIERNKHFSLTVTVDANNGATGDVDVVVDADMPAHQHGMNTKPEIFPAGDSQYRVEGMAFHMSGDWVITVDVTREGTTERASIPISVD
ncbi:MAG: hypothetical protein ACI9R3_001656 [Verrucomicrobiales bacterium]|jgi:hypothetical protein